MLQITFINDGTGNREIGNYDYTVTINNREIAKGRVEGHYRYYGWMALIQDLFTQNLDNWNKESENDWK